MVVRASRGWNVRLLAWSRPRGWNVRLLAWNRLREWSGQPPQPRLKIRAVGGAVTAAETGAKAAAAAAECAKRPLNDTDTVHKDAFYV